MKLFICYDLSCVYLYENDDLLFAPISTDNTFDLDEFASVQPELIGDEIVEVGNQQITFNRLYADVIERLTK